MSQLLQTSHDPKHPEHIYEAIRFIVEESGFDPGVGIDREIAARMLVEMTWHDWTAETTYVNPDAIGNAVDTSEDRAFRALMGWGIDATGAYRVLACFRAAQGIVIAERARRGFVSYI